MTNRQPNEHNSDLSLDLIEDLETTEPIFKKLLIERDINPNLDLCVQDLHPKPPNLNIVIVEGDIE